MGEAHPRPFPFGEAELAAVGGRLEQDAPALPEDHAELLRAGALDDRGGELVAGWHAAAQHVAHRLDHQLDLLPRDAEVLDPALGEVVPVGAERAEVDGEIARGQEMQRSAHRPDLDQRALAPERALEHLQARALDPRPEGEGGAGEELGVQPADPPSDAQLAAERRAPMQVVAFEPQGPRLFPPELHALDFTSNRSADFLDIM